MRENLDQKEQLQQHAMHVAHTYRTGRIPPEIAEYLLEVYSNTATATDKRNLGLVMNRDEVMFRDALYAQIDANEFLKAYLWTLQAEKDTRAKVRNTAAHLYALQNHVSQLHALEAEIAMIRERQLKMMNAISDAISQGHVTENELQQMVQDMYFDEHFPPKARAGLYRGNDRINQAVPQTVTLDEKIAAWRRVPEDPRAAARIASLTHTQQQIQLTPNLRAWAAHYHQAFYELEEQGSLREAQLEYKVKKMPTYFEQAE